MWILLLTKLFHALSNTHKKHHYFKHTHTNLLINQLLRNKNFVRIIHVNPIIIPHPRIGKEVSTKTAKAKSWRSINFCHFFWSWILEYDGRSLVLMTVMTLWTRCKKRQINILLIDPRGTKTGVLPLSLLFSANRIRYEWNIDKEGSISKLFSGWWLSFFYI